MARFGTSKRERRRSRVKPDEYILAVLSPQERLKAALHMARDAFKDATLRVEEVEAAVRRVRRRRYAPATRKPKRRSRGASGGR